MHRPRRLERIRPETSAAPAVLADFMMRRRRTLAVHRARPPPPWPENIIGAPPRLGDRRTPVERWQDWRFDWEAHFVA